MKRKRKEKRSEPSVEDWEQTSLERFKPLLSPEEYVKLVEEIHTPLSPALRFNPLKTTRNAVSGLEKRYDWTLVPIPFCPTGFRIIEGDCATPVSQTLEHRMGEYYIQEAASMLPVELFHMEDQKPELCLDLAASPGGKTTHLVSRGADHSLVIANDSSSGRIPALKIVLQNWGAANTLITQFPGEKYGMWFPETFDRVLIDAPCSMQGLRTAESHEVRPVTDKEISGLAKRQINLLSSALQAVKVDGEVVYSTCTLLPEEDEAVIDAILRRFADKVEVLQTAIQAPGILSYRAQQFNPEVQKAIRLWPNRLHTAGFFACLLRKKSTLDLPTQPAPARPLERTGFGKLAAKEAHSLTQILLDQYQFDLNAVMGSYDLVLAGYGQRRFAFPRRMLTEFADLPVQSAGLLIGEETADGFVPSHEWVSRFFELFPANRVKIPDRASESWLRGEDFMATPEPGQNGKSVVLLTDSLGRFLGRGRVTADRIKNLLPHRLV